MSLALADATRAATGAGRQDLAEATAKAEAAVPALVEKQLMVERQVTRAPGRS